MNMGNMGGGRGGGGDMGGMSFVINGKTFDMNRIDETITLANGNTEIWSIQNSSPMAHPFHVHAIQWQVLNRNGVAAAGTDLGWKDTVLVQPGQTVNLIGRFDPAINTGDYMYHCHILEHEDAGMMGIFRIQ
jgi:FtsP/CotA-like multicopper oxidase with cupredoxin domain